MHRKLRGRSITPLYLLATDGSDGDCLPITEEEHAVGKATRLGT